MKVKVLSCFYGQCPYYKLFFDNITEYCNKWGYELIVDRRDEDAPDNPYKDTDWFWWINHTMITEHLDSCDYIMWIDTDCIILNMNRKIESYFRGHDMVVVKEENPETGAFLIKNSEWSKKFLKDWKYEGGRRKGYIHHPAECNNYLVFCKMMNWYKIDGHIRLVKNSEFMVKHVHINWRTDATLIMHVPGSPFEHKVEYMQRHLKEVTR